MTTRRDERSFAPPGAEPPPTEPPPTEPPAAESERRPDAAGPGADDHAEVPAEARPPAGPQSPRGSDVRRANRALVAGLAVLAVGVAVLAARDRQPPPEPAGAVPQRLAGGAWNVCKRVVTERLGATPGVRFPWFDARAIQRVSDSVLVVRASVEAGGPAGARVQLPFACRARWLGGDRWLEEETVVRAP
jgi:hypothetical protein